MVVSSLTSGCIGVAMVPRPPLCPSCSPRQPPLSAASLRELIYNAHLGNTKGLLSSSRFNVFSPRVAAARCPFYTLFRRRHPFPRRPFFLFPPLSFSRGRSRNILPPFIRSSSFFCRVVSLSCNLWDNISKPIYAIILRSIMAP